MNKTESITIRINKRLKQEYKEAIRQDRTASSITDDLTRYINRKIKRSGND